MLDALGNVGEAIAALAVLVSLVYLGVQIRQNTTAVRVSTYIDGAQAMAQWLLTVASDPELSRILSVGRRDPDQLTPSDCERFDTAMDSYLANLEAFFVRNRAYSEDRASQDRWERVLRSHLMSPGGKRYWQRHRWVFSREFADYIDSVCLSERGDTPPKAS